MKQEWIERLRDQARAEKGFCTQASTGNWCDQHGALKFPGEEACRAMVEAYVIAESAGEVMEGLARTDAEDFFTTVTIPNIEAEVAALRASSPDDGSGWIEWSDRIRHAVLTDLRDKVEADRENLSTRIANPEGWDHDQIDQWASERVALNRVLTLIDEGKR